MYALGLNQFWKDSFNRFDVIVISCSVLEAIIVASSDLDRVGFSAFRSFRLLLIFKGTSLWSSMYNLVISLQKSIASIASLLFLLFIFMVVFALLGMQLFGGKFDFSDGTPRVNFDTFFNSMITIFQIFTGEDWNAVMYDGIRAYGSADSAACLFSLYFILVFITGNYILLNVFLAIALDNIGDLEEEEGKEEDENIEAIAVAEAKDLTKDGRADEGDNKGVAGVTEDKENEAVNIDVVEEADEQAENFRRNSLVDHIEGETFLDKMKRRDKSLMVFYPKHVIRRGTTRVCGHKYFENFILGCIIMSSCLLAMEDPVDADAPRNKVIEKIDVAFTCVFVIEMLLKVTSMGFVYFPTAYIRDGWNCMDAFVVIASVVSNIIQDDTVSFIKVLRVVRVLRPLRAIKRTQGLKRVIETLGASIKSIVNVVIIMAAVLLVYSIMGIQLFKGRFGYCTDDSIEFEVDCTGNYTVHGIVEERLWENHFFRYDDIARACLTMFTVATSEGWPTVMYNGIDATEEGRGPEVNHDPAISLYFISYLIIIGFFMVNIFVGFVIVQYHIQEETQFKECTLDRTCRKCIYTAITMKPSKVYVVDRAKGNRRYCAYRLVSSKQFELAIIGCIILNVIVLAMDYNGSPAEYDDAIYILNIIFTLIFAVEACLTMFAYTPKYYFRNGWMVFDFAVVLGSLLDIATAGSISFNMLRIFRVARLIKIVNRSGLKNIMFTLLKSLPSFPYVGILLGMVFFIYAVVGMNLFGRVLVVDGGGINNDANFRSFGASLLLLFRAATGEAWQDIMAACMVDTTDNPPCDPNAPGGSTCGSLLAIPYWISFVVVCTFLVLNLFVAIILDNFDYLTQDSAELGEHHLKEFQEAWSFFDPLATGAISRHELIKLLRSLYPPLGLGKCIPHRTLCRIMMKMDPPLSSNGMVNFNSALLGMVRYRLGIKQTDEELREIIRKVFPSIEYEDIMTALPDCIDCEFHRSSLKMFALELIQVSFKRWRRRADNRLRGEKLKKPESPTPLSAIKESLSGHLVSAANDNGIHDKPIDTSAIQCTPLTQSIPARKATSDFLLPTIESVDVSSNNLTAESSQAFHEPLAGSRSNTAHETLFENEYPEERGDEESHSLAAPIAEHFVKAPTPYIQTPDSGGNDQNEQDNAPTLLPTESTAKAPTPDVHGEGFEVVVSQEGEESIPISPKGEEKEHAPVADASGSKSQEAEERNDDENADAPLPIPLPSSVAKVPVRQAEAPQTQAQDDAEQKSKEKKEEPEMPPLDQTINFAADILSWW
eukprot:Nk52_evm18s2630 gene=Nk52_evmTU18s2630